MKLSNGIIHIIPSSDSYLFSPSLDNSYLFYVPKKEPNENDVNASNSMELKPQSFLGKLGYTVNRTKNQRRQILTGAVKSYGKGKVADHLAFLISTRMAQKNGTSKYSHALSIWQDDLNYIFNMKID